MPSSSYLDSDGSWLVVPRLRPIATRLENSETALLGEGWQGGLFNPRTEHFVWLCAHAHQTQPEAHDCGRKAWFAHHG